MLSRCLLAAVALTLVMTACNDESAEPAGLEDYLEQLPGVQDAAVEEHAVEEDIFVTGAVVDAEADASAAEIEAMVQAVLDDEWGDDVSTGVIYLDAGHLEWTKTPDLLEGADGLWFDADGATDPATSAGLLVNAARVFPDDEVAVEADAWMGDGDGTPALSVVIESTDFEVVPRAAERVVADEALSTAPEVSITAAETKGWGDQTVASLDTDHRLTEGAIADYERMLATQNDAPDVPMTGLRMTHAGADKPIALWVDIAVPGQQDWDEFYEAEYGDEAWPRIRSTLDVLRGMPPGSSLSMTNVYDTGAHEDVWFLDVRNNSNASDVEGKGPMWRPWHRKARAYLTR